MVILSACASTKTYSGARGTVELDRMALVELHEAFKSADEDKEVTIPGVGAAKCADALCTVSVQGQVDVFDAGRARGTEKIKGTLTFNQSTAKRLLDLIDEARAFAKEQADRGESGEAKCTAKGCKLQFAFDETRAGKRGAFAGKVLSSPGARVPANQQPEP